MNCAPWKSDYPEPKGLRDADSVWHLVFGNNPYAKDWSKPAFIDGLTGEQLTYGELRSMTRKLAYSLRHVCGLKRGDTVCIMAANSILYPAFVYATQAAGIVCTFANPAFTQKELAHILVDSDVKLIVTQHDVLPLVQKTLRSLKRGALPVFMLSRTNHPFAGSIWNLCLQEELDAEHLSPEQARKMTALRTYSSGTTGAPKGVNLSHANFHAVVRQLSATLPNHYRPDSRWICFIPLFHISGILVFQMLGPWLGGTFLILPKFDFDTYLHLIQKYRVTMGHLVPPIALQFAKSPKVSEFDLSSLEILRCGAAPLSQSLQEEVEKRLGVRCVGAYGMTETCGGGCSDTPEARKIGGNGPLLPGMQGQIVDGEMWFKGPNIMLGYHNNPKADAETFAGDGWLRSGDIVEKDQDGHIFVTDRLKELIKYKGFQVAPAELEALIISRPDVADCGCVPLERPLEATELPLAYIVLTNPEEASLEKAREIIDWAAKRSAPYKKLRGGIVFLTEIPKNASGKIMRRQLKLRKGDIPLGTEQPKAKL